jgi:hypothetical protein
LALELTDLYSALFELRWEELNSGSMQMSLPAITECNAWGRDSIKFARYMAQTVYDTTDDKFRYLQAILNMELSSANKWGKLYEPDQEKYMLHLKYQLECYERVMIYVKEYLADKGLTTIHQLTTEEYAQVSIAQEMLELLPTKIDRLNAQV